MPSPYPATLTQEVGQPGQLLAGREGRYTVDDSYEEALDLRWPNSVRIFDLMFRTDGQTASTIRAIMLPLRQTRWAVLGTGVDPRVRAFVEAELGLQTDEEGRRRTSASGFSFDEHLRTALLSLVYGFMPFEQVYALGPPHRDALGPLPPVLAHLRKLAPRMPRSLARVDVAGDGGLAGIVQLVTRGYALAEQVIPVDRLVMYANDRIGADWYGTSILRASYKDWLLKEGKLRLMAIAAERNSLGVPVVGFPADGSQAQALAIGKRFRAGEEAAVARPEGYTVELLGVTGTTVDLLPQVRYHDESIGRSALAMFLNLGHENGARSLGETFLDFFTLAENALAASIEETLVEHVVRDLVAVNFGPDEPYPAIKADEIETTGPLTADALAILVREGVVIPDLDLERHVRRRGQLPEPMRGAAPGAGGPIERIGPPAELPPPGTPVLPPAAPPVAGLGGGTGPPGSTTARGYGHAYQQARAALLARKPLCHWCRKAPATTADHDPPLAASSEPHLHLVPACGPCNFARNNNQPAPARTAASAGAPEDRSLEALDARLAGLRGRLDAYRAADAALAHRQPA